MFDLPIIFFKRFILEPYFFHRPFSFFGWFKKNYLVSLQSTNVNIASNLYTSKGAFGTFAWVYWFSVSLELATYNIVEDHRMMPEDFDEDVSLPDKGESRWHDSWWHYEPDDREEINASRFTEYFFDDLEYLDEEDMIDELVPDEPIYDILAKETYVTSFQKRVRRIFSAAWFFPMPRPFYHEDDPSDVDFYEWVHQVAIWFDLYLPHRKSIKKKWRKKMKQLGRHAGPRAKKDVLYETRKYYHLWDPELTMRSALHVWGLLDVDVTNMLEQTLYESGRLWDTFIWTNSPSNIMERRIPVIANEFKFRKLGKLFSIHAQKNKEYTATLLFECVQHISNNIDLYTLDKHYFEYENGFIPHYIKGSKKLKRKLKRKFDTRGKKGKNVRLKFVKIDHRGQHIFKVIHPPTEKELKVIKKKEKKALRRKRFKQIFRFFMYPFKVIFYPKPIRKSCKKNYYEV